MQQGVATAPRAHLLPPEARARLGPPPMRDLTRGARPVTELALADQRHRVGRQCVQMGPKGAGVMSTRLATTTSFVSEPDASQPPAMAARLVTLGVRALREDESCFHAGKEHWPQSVL
jgi:hypothetical protein